MSLTRRSAAVLGTAALAVALLAQPTATTAGTAGRPAAPVPRSSADDGQVALDWERIAFRTVYTDAATPVPVGVPVLGFTSLAMYRAVQASERRSQSSEVAALVTAAHDVLLAYYPTATTKLDTDESTDLATLPDDSAKTRGIAAGAPAAAAMLASREGDNYLSDRFHYSKPEGPGVWQPAPAPDMLAPWLGSLRHLVLMERLPVDGPDPLGSDEYAADFNEVKRFGSTTSTRRSDAQTATAQFFNSNSATMVGDALIRRLEDAPIGLHETTHLFAAVHASMTDSVIRCWQLKRNVGFWRPSQAIAGAATDHNRATTAEAGWTPLVATPPYSDYVSGHACLTGPAVEVIRRMLGEDTPLSLISVNSPTPRPYTFLSDIETDALNARIWSGLHFRDAMTDGYSIGHRTARKVMRLLD
jgi:hypothetical protein